MEVQPIVKGIEKRVTINRHLQDTKGKNHTTEVICGRCGAQERHMGNGKTECPNCDEYLD